MQGPRGDEALQGLDGYEQMVNTFAEQAKAYWRMWGPLGEPMIRGIDAWAEMQRAYVQWMRQSMGNQSRPTVCFEAPGLLCVGRAPTRAGR